VNKALYVSRVLSMLNELLKLVKYKFWANEITFAALFDVSDAELCQQRDTNFKNIPSTLNHVYVVDDIFRSHLLNKKHSYLYRNTETCPVFSMLQSQQKEIDQWYINFVSELEEKDLDEIITFEFVGGGDGEMSVSEIIFHVVNHGTYHRGFVSDMMYQIPLSPPANDYTVYLRDVYRGV
jgi:uncharacterized damage-inducible protein DinB